LAIGPNPMRSRTAANCSRRASPGPPVLAIPDARRVANSTRPTSPAREVPSIQAARSQRKSLPVRICDRGRLVRRVMSALGRKQTLGETGAVPESFYPAHLRPNAKPPTPPDLEHCPECGKVIGTTQTKGWFGPECQCGQEPAPGSALRGAHGAGRPKPKS
jgi:hypothetical protein